MSSQKSSKNTNNSINPHELRRKIIRIAKDLFLNPIEKGVNPKSKAPSKKAIISKLTQAEIEYVTENPDTVFPKNMPERVFWDVYLKRNMEKRIETLLRIVAEDNAIKIEREIVSNNTNENKSLPSGLQVRERLPRDEKEILEKYIGKEPILSTTKSLNDLSSKDRLFFLKNGKLPTEEFVQAERQEIYMKYVNEQKEFFEIYLNFLNKLLCELKKYRQIHDRTTMTSRIKGTDSALKNDGRKALDDVFGIETIYSTAMEKSKIEKIVASTIDITKEEEKNRSNGYQAYHISGIPADLNREFEETKLYKKISELYKDKIFYPNLLYHVSKNWNLYRDEMINKLKKLWSKYDNDYNSCDNIDINKIINKIINNLMIYIEIQSKTFEKAMEATHGIAAHYRYEALDKKETDLSEEEIEKIVEEFKRYIQEKFTNIIKMNDGEVPASIVPYMKEYLLDGSSRTLNPMETLMHIYPFFIDPKDLEEPQQVKDDINGLETMQ